MTDRFPDFDVLAKRDTPSWNEQTRRVIDQRLALSVPDNVLDAAGRATLAAVIDRIVPQPAGRPPVNALAILLDRIGRDAGDGFRPAGLPRLRAAWTIGLTAIDAEAQTGHGCAFADLRAGDADALLRRVEDGEAADDAWQGIAAKLFWEWRLIPDIVSAYYAHPSAWSAMGFGGPASPRGYVRLDADRRDPWEAAEADDGGLLSPSWRNRHVG